jgi:hypothetical protein
LSGGLTIGATTYLQSVLIQTSTLGGVGLQLPSLETVAGNLNITSNVNLAAIGLPALTTINSGGSLIYQSNSVGPASLAFPSLQTARVVISTNATLTSLSLPMYAGGSDFYVYDHALLASLTAPSLTGVTTQFSVHDNASLSCAVVQALLAQATSPAPSTTDISNNGGTCPPPTGPACPLCQNFGDSCLAAQANTTAPAQSCNQFYQCLYNPADGWIWDNLQPCPGGLVFSPSQGSCDWAGSEAPGCTP